MSLPDSNMTDYTAPAAAASPGIVSASEEPDSAAMAAAAAPSTATPGDGDQVMQDVFTDS